jgi:hypothetical protein
LDLKMRLSLVSILAIAAWAKITPTTEENMNGEYRLAQTPKQKGKPTWSTSFKDYPNGGVESFTIYAGPINSTYGEVFWKALPEVNLPADLVARFKGKGMAVVGFEADQVRRGAGPNGEDVSVPINVAYNHHYGANLLGAGSHMERVPINPRTRAMILSPEPGFAMIPVEHAPSPNGLPTNLPFGYSNGGEYRKTYHGVVPPYAQIIESPERIHITPMQIDTWNRDKMNLTGGKFVPGPYPKKTDGKWPSGALAPVKGRDAIYSGILECPMTTRIRKELTGGGWNESVTVQPSRCGKALDTAAKCFNASKEIDLSGVSVSSAQGNSSSLPAGCSLSVNGSSASLFFNTNDGSKAVCGAGVDTIEGVAQSKATNVTLNVSLSAGTGTATITLSGPADVWFGMAFDTTVMSNSPYAITVDGTGAVTERVLGNHAAGIVLNSSVTLVSHSVQGTIRTVVLSRALGGATGHYYSFNAKRMSLDFITALGTSSTFGYHKSKTAGSLSLWPAPSAAAAGGTFPYFSGTAAVGARNNFDGEVGYEITVNEDVNVTALGRSASSQRFAQGPSSGLVADATVTIWDVATQKAVATTTVGPKNNPSAANGYVFAQLPAPVALEAGRRYRVTLGCTKGMKDSWPDTSANAPHALSTAATIGAGYFHRGAAGSFPETADTSKSHGRWAGVATFMVQVPAMPAQHAPPVCICDLPAAPFGLGQGTIKVGVASVYECVVSV